MLIFQKKKHTLIIICFFSLSSFSFFHLNYTSVFQFSFHAASEWIWWMIEKFYINIFQFRLTIFFILFFVDFFLNWTTFFFRECLRKLTKKNKSSMYNSNWIGCIDLRADYCLLEEVIQIHHWMKLHNESSKDFLLYCFLFVVFKQWLTQSAIDSIINLQRYTHTHSHIYESEHHKWESK